MGSNRVKCAIIMLLAFLIPHLAASGTLPTDSVPANSLPTDSVPANSLPSDSVPANSLLADSVIQVKRPAVRKVTPVDIDDKKREPVMHYYDKHGNPLEEPVLFLASIDTVTKPKAKPVYPCFNGISFGLNFGDAVLMAFGQKYASFDAWIDVSLWNWIFPVIEAGIGYADSQPDNHNYSYKVRPSFFCKAGFNYNFLYKSSPDYQLYVGFRAGFSNFGWEASDVTISNSYWQESTSFNMTGMRSTAWWGEAVAGIKVKIVSRFSLGWNIRWHFPFSVSGSQVSGLPTALSDNAASKPWFIPGYGGSIPFTFALSAIWNFF